MPYRAAVVRVCLCVCVCVLVCVPGAVAGGDVVEGIRRTHSQQPPCVRVCVRVCARKRVLQEGEFFTCVVIFYPRRSKVSEQGAIM